MFTTMTEHNLNRLLYRACHRGTKELDLMLGGFALAHAAAMNAAEAGHFEAFLAQPDPDIDVWLRSGEAPEEWAGLVARIRAGFGR